MGACQKSLPTYFYSIKGRADRPATGRHAHSSFSQNRAPKKSSLTAFSVLTLFHWGFGKVGFRRRSSTVEFLRTTGQAAASGSAPVERNRRFRPGDCVPAVVHLVAAPFSEASPDQAKNLKAALASRRMGAPVRCGGDCPSSRGGEAGRSPGPPLSCDTRRHAYCRSASFLRPS